MARKWTLEKMKLEALKYDTRGDFQKFSNSCYSLAVRMGLIDEICKHMGARVNQSGENHPRFKWTQKLVLELVSNCKTYNEFSKEYRGAWKAATKLGIMVKIKKIFIEKENKIKINSIVKKILDLHGNTVSLKTETYINMKSAATFIDIKYGEWQARAENVIINGSSHPNRKQDKRRKTCLDKYGVDSVSKVQEISLKRARSQANSYIEKHWKTGKEIICQGGWEPKVVNYLNNNRIEYNWQSETFTMPNGKTYRPDFFLIKENKWIEIKGFFRKDALEKWDWFKTQFPTAELWNEKKLKEMRIL